MSIRVDFWKCESKTSAVCGVVLDRYNHEIAPGESPAVREYLPADVSIRSFAFSSMPSYVLKP